MKKCQHLNGVLCNVTMPRDGSISKAYEIEFDRFYSSKAACVYLKVIAKRANHVFNNNVRVRQVGAA